MERYFFSKPIFLKRLFSIPFISDPRKLFRFRLLYLLLALLSINTPIKSSALYGEDELYVMLGGENTLLPICISDIDRSGSTLSKSHLDQLNDILSFDLSHNGMTRVISGKFRQEILATQKASSQKSAAESVNLDALREGEISYYVQLSCSTENRLSAKLYSVQSSSVQSVNVLLTGDMSRDRLTIHKLSDAIFETLFKKPGIATSKILLTIKKRSGPQAGTANVFICDYDGANLRQLTSGKNLVTCPQWIPSKNGLPPQAFTYVSYEIGQPKLYYMSLKGGTAKRVTSMRGNQLTPAISMDGSMIAFISDFTGTSDLFMVPFQQQVGSLGKPRHLFHAKGSACGCPAFSPDGKKVAFVCNMDGSPKIYLLDIPPPGSKLASLKPKLITKKCRENTSPTWSPDGKKLAYSAKNGGDRQIWTYDFETGVERQLSKGGGNKENPSWASNSLHIAYNTSGSKNELFLINLNQTDATRIIQSSDDVQFAAFEPKLILDENKGHDHEVDL